MAKLPRRRARRLAAFAVAFGVLLSSSGRADTANPEALEPLDLVGTWHVLIHYTDDHSHDPAQVRWDDKIWVFERTGDRLRWTEYPIVVFQDPSGRFEQLGGARAARVVHGWEPNESQRAQIAAGLEVNPRGSRSKTLRKKDDGAWRSANRPTPAGASVVSYIENWTIEAPTTRPIFRREDSLGSATTDNYDGTTEFITEVVDPAAGILAGTFERDGSRHGTFRMTRSGAASDVKGKNKTEGKRFYESFLAEKFGADRLPDREALAESTAGPGDVRSRVRSEVRAALENVLREQDLDPRDFEREISSLSRQIAAQLVDEGRTPAEVHEMLAEGKINP